MSGKKQRQAESMHLITNCRPGTDLGVAPFARSLGDVITATPNRFHVVDQKHDRVGCRAMELGPVSAEWAPVLVRTKGLFLPEINRIEYSPWFLLRPQAVSPLWSGHSFRVT